MALRYGDLFGLDVIAVRPSNVYGPMERFTPGYAGATELREMLRIHFAGEPIKVASLDASYRDWTFAEDVAEGIERAWAVAGPLPQRVFILSSGEQYSVGEVLEAFRHQSARTRVQGRFPRRGQLSRRRRRAGTSAAESPRTGAPRLVAAHVVCRWHAAVPRLDRGQRSAVATPRLPN